MQEKQEDRPEAKKERVREREGQQPDVEEWRGVGGEAYMHMWLWQVVSAVALSSMTAVGFGRPSGGIQAPGSSLLDFFSLLIYYPTSSSLENPSRRK